MNVFIYIYIYIYIYVFMHLFKRCAMTCGMCCYCSLYALKSQVASYDMAPCYVWPGRAGGPRHTALLGGSLALQKRGIVALQWPGGNWCDLWVFLWDSLSQQSSMAYVNSHVLVDLWVIGSIYIYMYIYIYCIALRCIILSYIISYYILLYYIILFYFIIYNII